MQLADVEVTTLAPFGPSQEQVAGRLHQPKTVHHPLSVVLINALTRVGLQDGWGSLFDLKEQRVIHIGHHQDDGAKRAHTSYTDNLHGQVFPLEAIKQDPALVRQRLSVTRKSVGHSGLELWDRLLIQVINEGRI